MVIVADVLASEHLTWHALEIKDIDMGGCSPQWATEGKSQ